MPISEDTIGPGLIAIADAQFAIEHIDEAIQPIRQVLQSPPRIRQRPLRSKESLLESLHRADLCQRPKATAAPHTLAEDLAHANQFAVPVANWPFSRRGFLGHCALKHPPLHLFGNRPGQLPPQGGHRALNVCAGVAIVITVNQFPGKCRQVSVQMGTVKSARHHPRARPWPHPERQKPCAEWQPWHLGPGCAPPPQRQAAMDDRRTLGLPRANLALGSVSHCERIACKGSSLAPEPTCERSRVLLST